MTITINITTDPPPNPDAPVMPPDYPLVRCSVMASDYIEVRKGDESDPTDPPHIEAYEGQPDGGVSVVHVRPDREGLVSLIESLSAELRRMTPIDI